MQKIYNISLLFLAVLFIVLHNVTPHTHEVSGQGTVQISQAGSGMDNGLIIDLGGDHLNAFSRCQAISVEKNVVVDGNQITPLISWLKYSKPSFVVYSLSIPLCQTCYQDDVYLCTCVSRGPPTVS